MGSVLRFTGATHHRWLVHENCETLYCNVCEGGLGVCTVCCGAEGTLPTHCPGHEVPESVLMSVYAGLMDYRGGRWWTRSNSTEEWEPVEEVTVA